MDPAPAAAATLPARGREPGENLTKSHAASAARARMGRRARTAGPQPKIPPPDRNFACEPWHGQERHNRRRRIHKKEDHKT